MTTAQIFLLNKSKSQYLSIMEMKQSKDVTLKLDLEELKTG